MEFKDKYSDILCKTLGIQTKPESVAVFISDYLDKHQGQVDPLVSFLYENAGLSSDDAADAAFLIVTSMLENKSVIKGRCFYSLLSNLLDLVSGNYDGGRSSLAIEDHRDRITSILTRDLQAATFDGISGYFEITSSDEDNVFKYANLHCTLHNLIIRSVLMGDIEKLAAIRSHYEGINSISKFTQSFNDAIIERPLDETSEKLRLWIRGDPKPTHHEIEKRLFSPFETNKKPLRYPHHYELPSLSAEYLDVMRTYLVEALAKEVTFPLSVSDWCSAIKASRHIHRQGISLPGVLAEGILANDYPPLIIPDDYQSNKPARLIMMREILKRRIYEDDRKSGVHAMIHSMLEDEPHDFVRQVFANDKQRLTYYSFTGDKRILSDIEDHACMKKAIMLDMGV